MSTERREGMWGALYTIQARVLGSNSDSATDLLCDLGQLTGLAELGGRICLTNGWPSSSLRFLQFRYALTSTVSLSSHQQDSHILLPKLT